MKKICLYQKDYAKHKAAVTGSPLNKNGWGPEEKKTTRTGDSGSLREVISGVRTGAADLIKKIHTGFDKPIMKEGKTMAENFESMTAPAISLKNAGKLASNLARLQYGLTPSVFGKLGGQLLENIIRPGKQSHQFKTQIGESLDKAGEELKSEKEKNSPVPNKKDPKEPKKKKKEIGPRQKETKKVDFYYDKDKDGNKVKRNRNTREIIKD